MGSPVSPHSSQRPFGPVDVAALAVICAGTIALYAPDWRYDLQWGGVSTTGAERVMHGALPYRDFWTMYAPAHFYLLALLFHIFGTHLLVEVVAASVIAAAAACACYLLVVSLVRRRGAALACAAIFLAAMYNTGYYKRLTSYPPAITLALITLLLVIGHYRTARIGRLTGAGIATGILMTVKHDVACYTAIAVVGGLLAYHWIAARVGDEVSHGWPSKLVAYVSGIVVIVAPVALWLGVLAGSAMVRDLIIFPLTDFRYARPERYPSLLPFAVFKGTPAEIAEGILYYLTFALPFVLFLCGLAALGLAFRRRQPLPAAVAVMLSIGFLLHYSAAHVQINTHIVTMSVYASLLGVLFLDQVSTQLAADRRRMVRAVNVGVVTVWCVALIAKPALKSWQMRRAATAELSLPKVSGFRVPPEQARNYTELAGFIDANVRASDPLFVGLRRHDIVVFGDVITYFILDRPYASRYHELHPGIADTAPVQSEIVSELREKNVAVILLKDVLPDVTLDRVKTNFLRHLAVGATELDDFIRTNYVQIRNVGPYALWVRHDTAAARAHQDAAAEAN